MKSVAQSSSGGATTCWRSCLAWVCACRSRPDGAFYIYADVSALTDDSWEFTFRLLRDTGVCLVPGRDFGTAEPQRWVRISYATSLEQLREAVARMRAYLRPGQASGAALGLLASTD